MNSAKDTDNHEAQAKDGDVWDHQQISLLFLLSVGCTRLQILTYEVVSDTCESKRYLNGIMMVNFMFQFDWAIGYPTIWSNSILGVPVRVFRDKISIWIGGLSKADC